MFKITLIIGTILSTSSSVLAKSKVFSNKMAMKLNAEERASVLMQDPASETTSVEQNTPSVTADQVRD